MTNVVLAAISEQSLFRLALWNDDARARIDAGLGTALPGACEAVDAGALRLIWLEADHWLIACGREEAVATLDRLNQLAGADGVVVEVSGALQGRRIHGSGWRDLLMIAAVFDAESPSLVAGSVVRTIMHHSALLIDIVSEECVHAYVPASHAEEFFAFWDTAARRLRN